MREKSIRLIIAAVVITAGLSVFNNCDDNKSDNNKDMATLLLLSQTKQYIINEDFSKDSKTTFSWANINGSNLSYTVNNGYAAVSILNPGTGNGDCGFGFQDLTLRKNELYTISFRAWAGQEREILIKLSQDYSPYDWFFHSKLSIGPNTENVVFVIENISLIDMSVNEDTDMQMSFHLGNFGGANDITTVYFDDLKLSKK